MASPQIVMKAKGLVKRYGQVTALDGADFDQFGQAADLDEPAGVCRIHDQKAHLRVDLHVPALAALSRRVDQGTFAVVVDPHQTGLRLAVGQHGGQDAVHGARQ